MAMPFRRLPPLGSLRAFEAAARAESFKIAADELSVTPGAISQQIRGLEDDLGIRLFTRSARSVALTEAGKDLSPRLSAAFRQMRSAVDAVRVENRRDLTVTCTPPVASKWLAPRLHRFAERMADTTVHVVSSFAIEQIGPDGIQVAIRTYSGAPPPDLFAIKLFDEKVVPLASPELVERLDLRAPRDLRRAPLLHDGSLTLGKRAANWSEWFRQVGLPVHEAERGTHFAAFTDQALDAAVNSAGVVLGRLFMARGDMIAGRLVAPFGPDLSVGIAYYAVCAPGFETEPATAAFINWAMEETAAMAEGGVEAVSA